MIGVGGVERGVPSPRPATRGTGRRIRTGEPDLQQRGDHVKVHQQCEAATLPGTPRRAVSHLRRKMGVRQSSYSKWLVATAQKALRSP